MCKHVIIRLLIMLLLVMVSACTGDRSDNVEACDEIGTLFHDDFSGNKNCGWAFYNQGGANVELVEGSLQLTTSQTGQIWWTNPGQNFDDVIVTAQARQIDGPDDNAYGVICRYQNEENFYLFLISGDGYYAIAKYQSGSEQVEYLSGEGQFQPSDAINQGVATNQIEASCIGNELALSINGILVTRITDPTFVIGDIGLGASTFKSGTSSIQFDDIRVTAP